MSPNAMPSFSVAETVIVPGVVTHLELGRRDPTSDVVPPHELLIRHVRVLVQVEGHQQTGIIAPFGAVMSNPKRVSWLVLVDGIDLRRQPDPQWRELRRDAAPGLLRELEERRDTSGSRRSCRGRRDGRGSS